MFIPVQATNYNIFIIFITYHYTYLLRLPSRQVIVINNTIRHRPNNNYFKMSRPIIWWYVTRYDRQTVTRSHKIATRDTLQTDSSERPILSRLAIALYLNTPSLILCPTSGRLLYSDSDRIISCTSGSGIIVPVYRIGLLEVVSQLHTDDVV